MQNNMNKPPEERRFGAAGTDGRPEAGPGSEIRAKTEPHDEAMDVLGVPLERTTRGHQTENVHCGHLAVVSADGHIVAAAGDAGVWTFIRSTAKPVQAFPSVAGGMLEAFGLDDSALAMMTASHMGEASHVAALERMLALTGVSEEELMFHPTLPAGQQAREALLRSGGTPRKLYHVCAGKHIGMLALCRLRGWPAASYMEREHPLQQEVLRAVSLFSGLPAEAIGLAVDGCGLPVFAMPLWRLALIYARLAARPEGWADDAARSAAARIAAAMNARPGLVEGTGRLASVMLGDGNVVAKSGAQGVFVFALRRERLAVAVKVADGSEAAWPGIVGSALEQLGLGGGLAARVRSHFSPALVNDAGRIVGAREPLFRLRRR